jgi:MoxR-like ATPase
VEAEAESGFGPARAVGEALRSNVQRALKVRDEAVRVLLVALLADGHVLIEDHPGVGKTALARSLARSVQAEFSRIQCTADMLPADVTGTMIFNQRESAFEFHPGPIFANVVLVDEINRASPRTQAALLEPMEEHQVTVDGTCHVLPQPFFVMATQNPVDLAGTFPLPDSQLDRFLLRITLGYPEAAAEREMLAGSDRRELIAKVMPQLAVSDVLELRAAVAGVLGSEALVAYVQALLAESRRHRGVRVGLSPRAGIGLLQGARAHALIAGRRHALPEDVQALFVEVAAHRMVPEAEADSRDALAQSILKSVPVD